MKARSLVLALVAIFSVFCSVHADTSIPAKVTGVSGNVISNGATISMMTMDFIRDGVGSLSAGTTPIEVTINGPGYFTSVGAKIGYSRIKCTALLNSQADKPPFLRDYTQAGVIRTNSNQQRISDLPSTSTDMKTTLAISDPFGTIGAKSASTQIFGRTRLFCTYVAPTYTLAGTIPLKITLAMDGVTSPQLLVYAPNVIPLSPGPVIKGLGIYISYAASMANPTTFSIRGTQPHFLGKKFYFRSAPASRSNTASQITFTSTQTPTPTNPVYCEVFEDGVITWQGGHMTVKESGSAVEILGLSPFTDVTNYDLYCKSLQGIATHSEFPETLARYLPAMIEHVYEDEYYFYNTAYTSYIPVSSNSYDELVPGYLGDLSLANDENAAENAAENEDFDDNESNSQYMSILPYHISYYRNNSLPEDTLDQITEEKRRYRDAHNARQAEEAQKAANAANEETA